jgi:hypothetical protein
MIVCLPLRFRFGALLPLQFLFALEVLLSFCRWSFVVLVIGRVHLHIRVIVFVDLEALVILVLGEK